MPRTRQPLEWELEPDQAAFTRARTSFKENPIAGFPKMLALAEQGSLLAMLVVAHAWFYGTGTAIDKQQAEHWYRQVANAGSVFGHQSLGRFYMIEKRYAEAKPEFEFAAARGYGPARLVLGNIYLMGWGVEKNRDRACRYYEQAADRGNVAAKLILARMMIQEGSSWLERVRGTLKTISASLEAFRIGRKYGLDDIRLLRW